MTLKSGKGHFGETWPLRSDGPGCAAGWPCDGGQAAIASEPQVSHLPTLTFYEVWGENSGR